ncbi:sporulation protein [Jeotgalibacillus campisalis]|uniref:Sporulation protein n=1 Tax=Jeotgalibacillus campisalis TaxID=220754 RepID=A0A0C2RG23_9BACL|nr:sporulation protein [Jeotgalibacillus campisalis]KIL49130.1 hypothetical protein KR50_11650 [Jeotgalibacillus campisalis]
MINTLKKWIYRDKGKVDLMLNHHSLLPGDKISGEFLLKGPKSKKKVSRLECDLMLLDKETNTEKMVEVATTIYMSKVIDDKDWTKIPFSYTLPASMAKCSDDASYRFRTRLIFADNVQSIDHDEIKLTETH